MTPEADGKICPSHAFWELLLFTAIVFIITSELSGI
jgi:hypothetical protein